MAVSRIEDPWGRMAPLEWLRIRAAWFVLLAALFFGQQPTSRWLITGMAFVALGLILRALAAATLVERDRFQRGGIYEHVRHPLYLGNLLLGSGFACLGGAWWWVAAYLLVFLLVYRRMIRDEDALLARHFPAEYASYVSEVLALWPRLSPARPERITLTLQNFIRNNEVKNQSAFLLLLAAFVFKIALF